MSDQAFPFERLGYESRQLMVCSSDRYRLWDKTVSIAIVRIIKHCMAKKCSSQWPIPILPRKVNSVYYQHTNIFGRIGIHNKTQKLA